MDVSDINDIQAEAGVIATLIYHPDFILHSDYLKPGYFYNVENGCLYWAIQELSKAGIENIDALNLTSVINSNRAVKRKLDEYNIVNLQEYINMAQYAARHTLEEYKLLVNIVVEKSFKRDLIKATTEIQRECHNEEIDLSKLNQISNDKMTSLTEKYITGKEVKLLGEQIDEIWDKIENQDLSRRLPSKFDLFNKYFCFEPGELILLTARYKTGKSAYQMNELIHKLKAGVPSLYIDTEMSTITFTKRLISSVTGIPFEVIRDKTYNDQQNELIHKCLNWIKTLPLVHMYLPDSNMNEVYSICKILKYKMNLAFVIYDYLKSYNDDAYTNSALLGQMADFLKNKIAGELDLAVLSAAQLNRDDMIANSDNIAKAISTGIYWRFKTPEEIMNDGGLDAGNIIAYININRNGPQTDEDEAIFFNFDGDRQRITQAKIQKKDIQRTPFDRNKSGG